jgi:hypothetical protein
MAGLGRSAPRSKASPARSVEPGSSSCRALERAQLLSRVRFPGIIRFSYKPDLRSRDMHQNSEHEARNRSISTDLISDRFVSRSLHGNSQTPRDLGSPSALP